uniref:Family with sequence similarity 155 member A n=1 Tax=Suricata suricatta TaxID=37032 RepID=A0A673URJ1_SURSU
MNSHYFSRELPLPFACSERPHPTAFCSVADFCGCIATARSWHCVVYKAWLCSQYFEVAQFNCRKTVPCQQYCLEVQTRCPFILPDNDEVIYGGLSSFICTGLHDTFLTHDDPECCDVRREERARKPAQGTVGTGGACHRTSLAVSSAARLGNSRLKLCVLVLILLHTVLAASAAQNGTALGVGGLPALDEGSARDE